MEFKRTVYWNKEYGTDTPLDRMLGLVNSNFSLGVREMCCRESMNVAFVPASDNLKRLAQLTISHNSIRQIVEQEGAAVLQGRHTGLLGPGFTCSDCAENTVITGMDGVMVPLVTEEQKLKRRKAEAKKRKAQGRKSTARACRPKKGSDGGYKEFKIISYYDKDKTHQYAVGTSGDSERAGRILRKIAVQIKINKAERKYSVSDGAAWIQKQYQAQLPMLDDNVLDVYHFRDHLTLAAHALYGENSKESVQWREQMQKTALENGSLVLLDRLKECYDGLDDEDNRKEIERLRNYISKRLAMTDYPEFINKGYDIGSGPTESFCGCLTKRLKGSGMRWDSGNAEAIMALGSVYYSNLWQTYWKNLRKPAA